MDFNRGFNSPSLFRAHTLGIVCCVVIGIGSLGCKKNEKQNDSEPQTVTATKPDVTSVPRNAADPTEVAVPLSPSTSDADPNLVQEPGPAAAELPSKVPPKKVSKPIEKPRPAVEPSLKEAPQTKPAPLVKLVWLRDEELARKRARKQNRRLLIDFGATWCLPCEEYEKITFQDAAVKEKLAKMVLLKFDVSANSDADKALQKRFGVSALPALLVLSAKGKEITRVTKFLKPTPFLAALP